MTPQAVIFDMDGLTSDTERLGLQAWAGVRRTLGIPMTDELAMKVIGTTWASAKEVLFRELGDFDFERARAVWKEYMALTVEEKGIPVKMGLSELLDFLDSLSIKKAVATSSSRALVALYLDNAGLGGRFDAVITGNMGARGKPAPDIFLKAASELGVMPQDCMVLEDSPNGIKAAQVAGTMAVMVPDLIQPAAEIEAMLYAKVNTLRDVIGLIKKMRT
ncbi:MAG: HAD family phosphatase [Oscillospiraceae bacterium]|nr:HAD family phosphatase [Oscillospiraceae bacterium]